MIWNVKILSSNYEKVSNNKWIFTAECIVATFGVNYSTEIYAYTVASSARRAMYNKQKKGCKGLEWITGRSLCTFFLQYGVRCFYETPVFLKSLSMIQTYHIELPFGGSKSVSI